MDDKEKENVLNMSDEEFMNNFSETSSKLNSEPEEKEAEAEQEAKEETSKEPVEQEVKEEPQQPEEQKTEPEAKEVKTGSTESNDIQKEDNVKDNKSATIQSEEAKLDYKALYEKLMAPFKADGKTIQLKDVNEAIALMQKGVNYTRKTQNLAKYQKSILSLERANLLDASKLNNLINIYKGDKEAIRQLLAERKIDPMDLSSDDLNEQATNYVPENNIVADQDVAFRSVLDEVSGTPEGQAIISDMYNSDDTTKSELYKDPRIIRLLTQQKSNGIYDVVVNEINRRRTIGLIDASVPFIVAYNEVGNELSRQLAQNNRAAQALPSGSVRQPVVQAPSKKSATKFSNANNAKARAAATTRSAPASEPRYKNPLSMSDEEFMKTFGSRYR